MEEYAIIGRETGVTISTATMTLMQAEGVARNFPHLVLYGTLSGEVIYSAP